MNKEDIIKLAREAGFVIDEKARQYQPNCIFHTHHMVDELLTCFAALVAAAEREACARVCDFEITRLTAIDEQRPALAVGICAAAIRERGNT